MQFCPPIECDRCSNRHDNNMNEVMPECLEELGKASHRNQNRDGKDEFQVSLENENEIG